MQAKKKGVTMQFICPSAMLCKTRPSSTYPNQAQSDHLLLRLSVQLFGVCAFSSLHHSLILLCAVVRS